MINFGIKTNKTLDFLRADVKTVITYKEDKKESQSFYNENGDRTLRYYYDENESINMKQESTFQGKFKTGYINYDEYDSRTSAGQYELNGQGQIISNYHNGECEEQYQYDELGCVAMVYYPNTGAKDIYEYDSNNMAVKQLSISGVISFSENSMFGSLFGGPKKKLTTFENDSFGNIIQMKVFDSESNELLFTQKNKINTQGDEIESIGLNGDGSVYSESHNDYDYDSKNNWIIKRSLSKDGNVTKETKRQISYYSELDFNVNKSEIITDWKYKFKRLNGQRLALLFIALSKGLFQKPMKGQVYYESNGDESCTLFFSNEYHPLLKKSIDSACENGKFAQSNSESDWNDLKYAIDSAEISEKEDVESLELYSIYKE